MKKITFAFLVFLSYLTLGFAEAKFNNATTDPNPSLVTPYNNELGLNSKTVISEIDKENGIEGLSGSVSAAPCTGTTITWDGANWSNGVGPDNTTPAVLNGDYNTAVNGSFTACSLLVNNTFNLNIQNGDFIDIEGSIVVDGTITVSSQGSVVQRDDLATITGTGTMQVTKRTAPMNNAFEYTYWSSPTANTTINVALSQGDINRRFLFNAQNYLDQTSETNNDNTTVAGPDDIDDDNNDWTPVIGTDVMQAGVGYASTHDPTLFASTPGTPPYQFDYIFEGPFNNGVITVPVYRNDSYLLDNNWNFIGNPYPSAIDVNAFFAENAQPLNANGAMDGVIHFWSHDTDPDANNNGNQNINFDQGDYATINTVGGIGPSNDGQSPNGFIPSGQGFFVAMSDAVTPTTVSGDIATSEVVFNNSMRVTGNNNQFFRNPNPDNKLWINLTSDDGIFSQILIGYVNDATAGYDGNYIDAPRHLGTDISTRLYSSIEDSTKKFVIQGKATTDLSLDEIIPLGISTTLESPTIYNISIAQLQGQFLNDNSIYIKDNLLDTIHNLKESDYNFTSEAGEFNDRFEIVFQESALNINTIEIGSSDLSIVELNDGRVEFTIRKNLTIQEVVIQDLVGREIYRLSGHSSVEIYNLDKLTQAAYIAQVRLSNGQIITKKAIKRR
ncbi:hypothetical protein [Winogradskyella aurantia]|uniref:Secretion system C-terminal sorting domain-containing protein n=1 Tax=Winogradskyella aurantia TaxID=1915063 RepID=A0A265UZG3_9FLAO|nr:hypothetical protein [Winogradskyella aurantia]OZV70690.1 hypothetical protein CA834_00830 [Winogradskyella aurantia]